ncbi:MAG: helix-hairpin-helix domain-containing protein [Pseudomonadales bacterium]
MKGIDLVRSICLSVCLALGAMAVADDSAKAQVPLRVNINTADVDTLALVLDGVGRRRAEAIVKYRQQYGDFRDAAELVNVTGIVMSTVTLNEERIIVQE